MSLGTPSIGTPSIWYSEYDSNMSSLLQRLSDNSSNMIVAKDVRDPIWTLYNQIQTVASQSLTQSSYYTLGTPSTISVGGISDGTTFSNVTFQQLFDSMLIPYVAPETTLFETSVSEYQFGQSSPSLNLNYSINVGSSPLSSISFEGPYLPITPVVPSGTDPESGVKTSIVPTYSTTVSVVQHNFFTMSFVTVDSLTFSATASTTYKHKRYYGQLTIAGGFTSSEPSSVLAVQTYLTDSRIKGLSYSNLGNNVNMSQAISFSDQYFVFAAPTVFGFNFPTGFFIDNIFSQDFTKIKSGSTFSNEYSYNAPYDVWISNTRITGDVLVSNNSMSIGLTNSIYTVLIGETGATGPDGATGSTGATGSATSGGVTYSFQLNDGMGGLTGVGYYDTINSNLFINDKIYTPSVNGTYSTSIGIGSGLVNVGCKNTFIGNNAGCFNTSGEFNTFIGAGSGESNTTGQLNTFIGSNAGKLNSIGVLNTFVGQNSGFNNTTGSLNTFIGAFSGRCNISGCSNVFIGYHTGEFNTIGIDNTFVGQGSGYSNTTGSYNTFMGQDSGFRNIIGSCNVLIGVRAGYSATQSGGNVFIGNDAGYNNITSGNSTFVGGSSGYSNTTGWQNIFIGYRSGYGNVSGSRNVFIGDDAGFSNQQSDNVFVGNYSGRSNTYGCNNVFIGESSGYSNIVGTQNVLIGYRSGYNATQSNNSVFIGSNAGYYNVTSNNTFIGHASGYYNTSGFENTFIGYLTGYLNETGNCNVFIGHKSGCKNVDGNDNTFIGSGSGRNSVSGFSNTFIGSYSGLQNIIGSKNTFIGYESGNSATQSFANTLIGYNSGRLTTEGSNTFVGSDSGAANTTGSRNTFIGQGSGTSNTTGCNNTFIGYVSGSNNYTGANNVFIGPHSGATNSLSGGYGSSISIGVSASIWSDNQFSLASAQFPIGTASTATASGGSLENPLWYLCVTINGVDGKIPIFGV